LITWEPAGIFAREAKFSSLFLPLLFSLPSYPVLFSSLYRALPSPPRSGHLHPATMGMKERVASKAFTFPRG